MLKLQLNIVVVFTIICNLSAQETSVSARQLGQSIGQCFGGNELINCFETKIFEALDQAIANNETWKMSDFLIVEKNTKIGNDEQEDITKERTQRMSLSDKLALKILQLAQMRTLKFQLPPSSASKLFSQRGIYSGYEDLSAGDVIDVGAAKIGAMGPPNQEEGRKRGHKDKNIAMMGGMAMLAMFAQMFLGKVILIAGAAFVMAKVALIISTLGSLKKGSSGSLAGKDHVIVTGGSGVSGDHDHELFSGWHRRSPWEHMAYQTVSPALQNLAEPMKYFEGADNNYLQKRHTFKKPQIKES